jgi:hypothetical protein
VRTPVGACGVVDNFVDLLMAGDGIHRHLADDVTL